MTQVTAARSWHFPALNGPAHDGLLLLFNPNRVPLEVTIATPGGTDLERADIGAQKSAEADLIGLNSMRALQVRATAPIVAHRMVVRHGALQAAPGQTGQ